MGQELSRRDFLKLLGVSTLTYTTSSNFLSYGDLGIKSDFVEVPNILILVLDTLSARHMSTFGYQRQTTPNMTRFAEQSFVYHNHYASGNFTSPGTASLLTGVYPWSHWAIHEFGTTSNQFVDKNLFSLSNESHYISTYTHNKWVEILLHQFSDYIDQLNPMIKLGFAGEAYSEKLFPSDFTVASWSEDIILRGGRSILPGSLFFSKLIKENLMRHIRALAPEYQEKYPDGPLYNYLGMFFLLEQAIDWIQEQMVSLPDGFLAYYHLWPPHAPYRPRADFINIFDDGLRSISKPELVFSLGSTEIQMRKDRQKYDEYLAFVDSEFGRLIDFMEMEDIFQNTMVILTSDHGELFERGIIGHSTPTLYENLLRVPLLISLPGQKERVDINTLTNAVDLLPTLLKFIGYPIPDFIEGQVLPGFNPTALLEDRSIFAIEAKSNSKFGPLTNFTLAMIKGRYKLIHYQGYQDQVRDELYDLQNDPDELANIFESKKSVSKEMMLEISEKLDEVNLRKNES